MGTRGLVALLTLVVSASAVDGWAFWTAPGEGTVALSTGSFLPATLSTPASATNSVTLTWTDQASLVPASASNDAITYILERKSTGGSFAAVSSGGCSGAKPYGITSCTDAPSATGSYTYRVVASFATWTATSSESGPVALLVDTTAPTVSSINRVGATPSNLTSVSWTVTFSEAVTGVNSADFALAATGPTATSITAVTGSGTTYTVTVSTGSGDGSLGLNLADDDTITDAATNKLGGTGTGNGNLTGQTYTIDKTAPTVSSIDRVGASLTNATSVSWTVTFSEAVTGVNSADFALAATGPTATSITAVTGSGTTYTATVSTGSGDGSLGLNLADDDTITDAATNKLGGTGTGNGNLTGQTYTIDKTAPTAPSAISVLSGVLWSSPPTCTGVTSNTRYINGTATSASAATTRMTANVEAEPGLTIVFSATSSATTVTSAPLAAATSPVTTTQDLSSLPDGLVTLTAYAVDAAGNTSATGTSTEPLRKDTIIPTLTATYRSGLLSSKHIDGVSECAATIAAVKLTSPNAGRLFTDTAASDGSYDIDPVDGPPLFGSVSYSVTATDRAGNVSAAVITGS